jgi:hypothetical protein
MLLGNMKIHMMSVNMQILDHINHSSSGYSFLRVLEDADRREFLSKYPKHDRNELYEQKCIQLNQFLQTMDQCKFANKYILYRIAYDGEWYGRREISDKLSSEHIVQIYQKEKKNNKTCNSVICGTSHTNDKVVRILLIDDRMELLKPGYTICPWQNPEYKMQNSHYI